MITTKRRVPVDDAGDPAGPACPDGRLLALRCLGIPQVATRAAMSRRRTLMRSLAAFCARIQPRNTAELASLVLHMGEEIDRRERMLDAALRAVVTVPGERIPGSRQHPGQPGPGSRNRSASLPPYDALAQRERPHHGRVAGSRAEPADITDAPPTRTATALS